MSTATPQRWALVEDATCTVCESEGEAVDTKLELADGTRVKVCVGCTEQLAVIHKLGSEAAAAVLEQMKRELAAREQMLSDRDAELAEQAAKLEVLGAELERLRAEAERRKSAAAQVLAAAQELS